MPDLDEIECRYIYLKWFDEMKIWVLVNLKSKDLITYFWNILHMFTTNAMRPGLTRED